MIHIRHAVDDDLPAIARLFNALIPTTTVAWRDHLADDDEMNDWFARQRTAGDPVLVADDHAGVVGFASWTQFRGGPRFPGYQYTVEHTIHVEQTRHRRGVGRQLMTALIDTAFQRNVHVMVAGIDAANTSSIDFHTSLGFTEVARMPQVGRKFDRWLDLVLMQRIIK